MHIADRLFLECQSPELAVFDLDLAALFVIFLAFLSFCSSVGRLVKEGSVEEEGSRRNINREGERPPGLLNVISYLPCSYPVRGI